jgi:tRNA modification GTPase
LPLPPTNDTIAAIATGAAPGAVGIVRLSGDDAFRIAEETVVLRSGRRWQPPTGPRGMHIGRIVSDGGEPIDDAVVLAFYGPQSYTGENVTEFQVHGGPAVLKSVLNRLLACGARQAEAGEFTLRAVLHGKMDLLQAEGVLAMVDAKTERARRQATFGLTRALGERIEDIYQVLVSAYGDVTAVLDYPEEGVELNDVRPRLREAASEMQRLVATAEAGRITQQGAKLAIVGRPNVGKSSLLNALLGYERSIVSQTAGTTRDYLEGQLEIRGIPITVIDTAGLRETDDPIEAEGVAQARELAGHADLVLFLSDQPAALTDVEQETLARLRRDNLILVHTKIDLNGYATEVPGGWMATSAVRGTGLAELKDAIRDRLLGSAEGEELWIGSERHAEKLAAALAHVERCHDTSEDLMALELQDALAALGTLLGKDELTEDTLSYVFANFCVGK